MVGLECDVFLLAQICNSRGSLKRSRAAPEQTTCRWVGHDLAPDGGVRMKVGRPFIVEYKRKGERTRKEEVLGYTHKSAASGPTAEVKTLKRLAKSVFRGSKQV